MKRGLIFPLFNGFICAIFGALIGYYISRPYHSILIGVLIGLLLGVLVEAGLSLPGINHWLYRRRVILVVLLEIPLAIFLFGPYAYVIVQTRPDQHEVCCETPLDYGATSYEDVLIPTKDGNTLAGWLILPTSRPGAVVIMLHGARSDRRDSAWHARQLIHAGYGVLLYDQRALGESSGDTVSLGWLDGPDLLAALDYLSSRSEVDTKHIGVIGLSGGGHIALNAAYLAPERFAALWLDGVQVQQIEDFPKAQNFNEQFATFINRMILKMVEIHLKRPAPPAFIQILADLNAPPIVLVAGGLDDFERRANLQYASILNENAQVWLIDSAWHCGGPVVVPEEYSQRMLKFFKLHLTP